VGIVFGDAKVASLGSEIAALAHQTPASLDEWLALAGAEITGRPPRNARRDSESIAAADPRIFARSLIRPERLFGIGRGDKDRPAQGILMAAIARFEDVAALQASTPIVPVTEKLHNSPF
jgi:hypothetical protein